VLPPVVDPVGVIFGAVLVIALLTSIPARRSVSPILQAEMA
jgi:hypothetical protein